MRLIDADALEHEFMSNMHYLTKDMVMDAAYKVNKAPTIDAVPVVRCRECKQYVKDVPGCTDFVGRCALANYMIGATGYCLYGERKDGGG